MVKPIGVLECPTLSMAKMTLAEETADKTKVEEDWVVVRP